MGFLQNAAVLILHLIGSELSRKVHHNNNNNQERCSAEVELNIEEGHHELGYQADKYHVHRADEGKPCHNLVNMLRSSLTRTDAVNVRSALLQVLAYLPRVEHERGVEEADLRPDTSRKIAVSPPNQEASVPGNMIMLEAKIAGITPDWLILSGRCCAGAE